VNLNCTTENYDTLYARWLERPGALLDWGGYQTSTHKLLDLCGGTGAVAREARARGGFVSLLDLNPRCPDRTVESFRGRAEDLRFLCGNRSWNFVVCRQALGYLNLPEVARALHRSMLPDGVFICNTFVKPKWSLRPYRFNGRWYLEASGFFGRRVFHLQAMVGAFDVTAFQWYSVDEIRSAFSAYFTLERLDETAASLRFLFRRK
jgi:ubiquinone/menaquinone biosynthesis C-methylase UbiE